MLAAIAVGAGATTAGGCGPPVGVLTTATPMGVAVTGAGGGGVNVEPTAAVAIGRGVRVNWRVDVGWSPDVPPGALVADGVRVAVAVAVAVAVGVSRGDKPTPALIGPNFCPDPVGVSSSK